MINHNSTIWGLPYKQWPGRRDLWAQLVASPSPVASSVSVKPRLGRCWSVIPEWEFDGGLTLFYGNVIMWWTFSWNLEECMIVDYYISVTSHDSASFNVTQCAPTPSSSQEPSQRPSLSKSNISIIGIYKCLCMHVMCRYIEDRTNMYILSVCLSACLHVCIYAHANLSVIMYIYIQDAYIHI